MIKYSVAYVGGFLEIKLLVYGIEMEWRWVIVYVIL